MARRTKRRRSQAGPRETGAEALRQRPVSATPQSDNSTPTSAPSRIIHYAAACLTLMGSLLLRAARILLRALASVDWRALGVALLGAAIWTAKRAWAMLREAGRLTHLLARGLAAFLRSVDWRGLAAAASRAAASAAKALLRGARMVPSLLLAAGRGVFLLARAVAIVAVTLLFSTLFVGAVLLGAGHVTSDQEERERPIGQPPTPTPSSAQASGNLHPVPRPGPSPSDSDQPPPTSAGSRLAQASTSAAAAQPPGSSPVAPSSSEAAPTQPTTLRRDNAAQGPSLTSQGQRPPSCSSNTRVQGPLLKPASLPDQGRGFERIFPHRNLSHGTDELVGAIERAAAALYDPALPPLMVGNLSGPSGDQAGADPFHPARYSRGQGAGRAGDLLFFLTDALGRPVPAAETNIEFDAGGRSVAGVRRIYIDEGDPIPEGCHLSRRRQQLTEAACPIPAGTWRVDFDRSWQLVRALLTDPVIGAVDDVAGLSKRDGDGIRFIFVDEAIKRGILSAAREAGEPEALVEIAGILLHAPSNASTFDRFMRLDLWCTEEDKQSCDCRDGSGPWNRWRAEAPIGAPNPPLTPRVAAASGR